MYLLGLGHLGLPLFLLSWGPFFILKYRITIILKISMFLVMLFTFSFGVALDRVV
jgi:hypothetical protein